MKKKLLYVLIMALVASFSLVSCDKTDTMTVEELEGKLITKQTFSSKSFQDSDGSKTKSRVALKLEKTGSTYSYDLRIQDVNTKNPETWDNFSKGTWKVTTDDGPTLTLTGVLSTADKAALIEQYGQVKDTVDGTVYEAWEYHSWDGDSFFGEISDNGDNITLTSGEEEDAENKIYPIVMVLEHKNILGL
ncbi:hypothetical protein FACS1894199_02570 [Bacteroidia bacterium]|nr:hypothetical protein FACS1894199_02570 [Bacteroidia bacterium]